MRKYLYLYKSEFMSTLQYVFNITISMMGYIVMIFIFFNLWNYIYDDPSQLIHGYSKNQMIWYVIITEILWIASGGRRFCKRICDDVRSGNIAYVMNKPYSYISYVVASHLGEATIRTIIVTIIGFLLGFVMIGNIPSLSLIGILFVCLSGFLAIVINTVLITFIGLFSFIIEDANPLYWIYSKLLLIVGTIFPVEFFPTALQGIIKLTPIYVTCYGPAKLFVNFTVQNGFKILMIQFVYLLVALGLCNLLYQKGVKKLNVNGG